MTRLTLRVVEGKLQGQAFNFESPRLCQIGRSRDCDLRLPGDLLNVSRHHCLLVIDESGTCVRDLGSRNGTYLNRIKIGQRDRDWSVTQLGPPELDTYEVFEGDQLRVGDTVFRIEAVEEPAWNAAKQMAEWDEQGAPAPMLYRELCGCDSAPGGYAI